MKTRTNKLLMGTLLLAVFGLNSCKKEETPVTTDNSKTKAAEFSNTVQRQMEANVVYYELATSILPEIIASTAGYMKNNEWDCAAISIDSSGSPRVATIDFGGGCTDSHGRTFTGIIYAQYNNEDMGEPGCHILATFNNFTCDSLALDGTFDYNNNGYNVAGNRIGTLDINMTTGFAHDKLQFTGATNFSFEWISARSSAYLQITGSGVDGNGVSFTQSTGSPIVMKQEDGCGHFVSGTLTIQTPGVTEEIDYGTGDCDDQATSVVNGGPPTTITLD